MKNYKKLLFVLCYLFKLVFNQKGIITLPFKKEVPDLNGAKPKDFFSPKMATNLIMTELKVGTGPQTVKLRLEFESYFFYIASQSSVSELNLMKMNPKHIKY